MRSSCEIYCDFDGTVTVRDTIDVLLEELGDPAWREIEQCWVRGELGARDCLARQLPLIRGGWDAVCEVLAGIEVDPTFPDFARRCRDTGLPLHIVSDGLGRIIEVILARHDIHVTSVTANEVLPGPGGNLIPLFPHARHGCAAGVCKCRAMKSSRPGSTKVVVGDGLSDACWAWKGDLVFARGTLLDHCIEQGLACIAFEDFRVIGNVVGKLFPR